MHSRPTLPVRYANPHIQAHLNASHLPVVKYQILNCQGKDILVGRLKIDTPDSGHAFILRRFDTGAVSLTTMFRAAFPLASDAEEKAEIQWVKDSFDLAGNNGSSKEPHITRLAGTWVSPHTALQLGKEYGLGELINVVVEAQPDPNGSYRRSGKSANSATTYNGPIASAYVIPKTEEVASPASSTVVSKPPSTRGSPVKPPSSAAKTLPTPSPTSPSKPPSKRRRESSPAQTSESSKPPSRASPAPPSVRRSARTKSPAPAKSVAPLSSLTKTPRSTRSSRKELVTATPGGSELAVVVEEHQVIEDGMMGTLRDEDIKEQQELIQDLKAKREAAKQELVKEMDVEEESSQKKRERDEEDAPLQFEFKEPETEERTIATNRRVGRFQIQMEPRTKSFAWGVAAFAIGMGAVTYLPNFF